MDIYECMRNMDVGAHVCEPGFFVFFCVCVNALQSVSRRVQEGLRHRWERVMSGPRADTGNTIHRGEGWIRYGRGGREREGSKEREKKREIQGEVLLSLTTKMEVKQGQIVEDHLTRERCTCLIFPDMRGHHCSLTKPKPEGQMMVNSPFKRGGEERILSLDSSALIF